MNYRQWYKAKEKKFWDAHFEGLHREVALGPKSWMEYHGILDVK